VKIIDQKTANIKKNLVNQIDACMRGLNEKGFETRQRYYDATTRFCGFLAHEFHSRKFVNIKDKHIRAYVNYLKAKGYEAATIKTELSGIRFFAERMGCKNKLPDNNELGLEKRQIGGVYRAWTQREFETAIMLADSMGKSNIVQALTFGRHFGVRINEACIIPVKHLKAGLYNGELSVLGKGGQWRTVPVETSQQRDALRNAVKYAEINGRFGLQKFLSSPVKGGVKQQKNSIQNWISNHHHKFMDRPSKTDGFRTVSKQISFHGLRHVYAQDRYKKFISEGMSEKEARFAVSEELGHHRDAVTRIYVGSGK